MIFMTKTKIVKDIEIVRQCYNFKNVFRKDLWFATENGFYFEDTTDIDNETPYKFLTLVNLRQSRNTYFKTIFQDE